ncbi:MAG: hypothetical protein HZB42_13265 [Sphingobacteriales bacterium]|nr:hypothetical protein [Sphingobacteriales bacterium]
MKQKIIVTALPNGVVTRSGLNYWKISAALGLQVEDADTTLQNVPDMMKWAELVKNAKFIVQLNGNTVEAKVVSKPVDTALWKNLFYPSVKVKSFVQEDLAGKPIASYPVKHVLAYIKGVVEQTGKNFSADLPDSNYYTENPILTAISDYSVAEFPKQGREKITLKQLARNKQTGSRIKAMLEKNKSIPFGSAPDPSMDFAQLKNFHGLYDAKEVKNFKQVEKPEFEFHNILSVLSGYPQLQRKLGLVVDLEFTPPSGLMVMPAQPNIRIIPSGINFSISTTYVCPATAYTKTTNGFYSKPSAGSVIDKGHLKINSDAFTVFQVDTDGAALKICQQVDALQLKKAKHIFYAANAGMPNAAAIPFYNNEAPRKEGLPSHRTAGIAVARNGMADNLSKKFQRMNDLKALLIAGAAAPAGVSGSNASWVLTNEILFADDINMGYRMDVQPEDKPGKWVSLHKRNNKYSYLNISGTSIDIPGTEPDEGFIQTSASEEKTDSGTQLKVGEAIARWEGWSLSVPRPGSALNDPMLDKEEVYDKTKAGNADKENAKYKTPGTADFRLNVKPGIEKGTLPMLRFGKKYAIRIRTVDLAGNSVDLSLQPETPGDAVMGNIRYMRYEPVDAPFLVLGNVVKDGESAEVMAIRSNEGLTTEQYENANIDSKYNTAYKPESVRHVKPPRTSVEMSTTHSMLDKGIGPANSAEAAAIYTKIKNDKDPLVKEEDATSEMKVVDGSLFNIPVEYLADPMAAGVTFFISANDPNPKIPDPEILTRRISFYFDSEVTDASANDTADYNAWMNPKTFRITLKEGSPNVKWDASSRTLVVTLQKGVMFKMNYACFWRPNDILKLSGILDMMGMTGLADAVGKRIARGQHWMFSPWREITFVHAVQQPISKIGTQNYPDIAAIVPDREYGANTAKLNTKLFVHGPSTGQLDMEADWTEWVDDVTKPELEKIPTKSKVFHFTTLYAIFEYVFGEIVKGNPFPAIQHMFNDTKHRMVNYKTIATTRYREYFYQLIADKGAAFSLTRESSVINNVNILSSARPSAPQVEYVIPTFEWDRVEKGNLTLTGRASGLRIYLKRPWYSSGEGEQLAVVLPVPTINFAAGSISSAGAPYTTWGTDPTKLSAPLLQQQGTVSPIPDSFVNVKPENKDLNLSVAEHATAKVNIVAFDVKYDKDRQLYYADIMLNILTSYYPFVRLALARYQRHSLRKDGTDCCLSPIVVADYIQIPSTRASSIQFGASKNNITVAISGNQAGVDTYNPYFRSKVEFVIEPIDVPSSEGAHITISSRPIDSYNYVLTAADVKNFGFYHSHVFNLPAEYAGKPYRVKVLEYEVIIYDPLKPNPNPAGATMSTMPMKDRLVFADVYEVNK